MDYFHKYYSINRILLDLTEVWPKEKSTQINFRSCTIAFFISITFVHQFEQLFKASTLDMVVDSLYIIIPFLCITVAYYTVVWNSARMGKLVYYLKHGWEEFLTEEEFNIMHKYAMESKIFTICISCLLYTSTVIKTVQPAYEIFNYYFNNKNDTVLHLLMPPKHFTDASIMYYTLLLQQILASIIFATIASGIYSSFLVCVQHACALLDILTIRLNQPFEEDRACIWFNDEVKDSYHWLIDITKRYEEVIKFIDVLNSLAANSYLVEAILGTLLYMIIFLLMIQIFSFLYNIVDALALMSYMLGCLLILFINCTIGQRLIDHSTQLFEISSHIPFHDIPVKCHKPLLLLMMRSMKPCSLSVGGLFSVSHSFFSEIMQKSYSYAMVCYTMN